jgi:hypothetical protein
MYFFL